MEGKPLSEHTRRRILESGDTSLWAPVIQWYRYRLIRYIEGLGADHHLAEDVAQNTFIKAVQKFDQFSRDCGSFAPWLFAIARNELRSAQRGNKAREQGTGTTTWMGRQQELEGDDVQLSDLQPTLDDREQALLAAISNPRFPNSEELVAKELFQQLEFLVDQGEAGLVERIVYQLIARLDQAAFQRYENATEVCAKTPRQNWEVFLLRQYLQAPAKLTAKILRIEYSANIHKLGYRIQERLREKS